MNTFTKTFGMILAIGAVFCVIIILTGMLGGSSDGNLSFIAVIFVSGFFILFGVAAGIIAQIAENRDNKFR